LSSLLTLFYYSLVNHLYLHSFPTRRSSDLQKNLNQLKQKLCNVDLFSFSNNLRYKTEGMKEPNAQLSDEISQSTLYFYAHNDQRSEEHTSELQLLTNLVCRLLLEKKKKKRI